MERFRSFSTPSNHDHVDAKAGVINACSVAVAGEAAGHQLIFDQTTLRQLLDIGNSRQGGIKSRFTHPGLSEDGLGKFLGRMRNFHLAGDRLVGDLYLSNSSANTPHGNLKDYILALATEDPAAFGISVVVDLEKFWIDLTGKETPVKEPKPDKTMYKYPVARILSFVAADAVDEPALNPAGLFNAHGNLVASNQVADEVFQELDNYIQFLGFDTPKAYQFALRYFQSRGIDCTGEPTVGCRGEAVPPQATTLRNNASPLPQPPITSSTQINASPFTAANQTNQLSLQEGEQVEMSEDQAVYNVNPSPVEPAPAEPTQPDQTHLQIKAMQEEIFGLKIALTHAAEQNVIKMSPTPPRESRLTIGLSGLDHFQSAFDWVFGVDGARLPPPDLRRTDGLYRILTGDLNWHGVFDPAYAFAGATTTTLADLAANAMNKVIVELYNRLIHYRWYELITSVQPTDGTLQDMAWIQFGGIANLPTVAEGAAYTELDVADSKESDAFVKYGGYVGITDKMIRNSEIAKMQAIPRALTISAIQTRSAAIAAIFTSNSGVGPTLDQDSTALFHTNHANLATTAYSWSAWKAARLECAKQTELGSSKRQMLFPKFLLLPADLYDQALIDFGYGAGPGGRPGEGTVTAFNDVNPYAMDRPGDPRPIPVAVPEFTDTGDWAYLVDPKIAPVICMAYASSPGGRAHPAPELFTVTSPLAGLIFTNDTIPIKIRDWFAYGVATYRGIGKRNVA
jgi:hypothetical protein